MNIVIKLFSKLFDLIDPAQWLSWLIGGVVALVLGSLMLWFFNGKIRDHYQAPLIAQYKEAADEATRLNAKRESLNLETATKAKDEKFKTLENNLAAANRTAAGAIGLRDAIRASEDRAKTDLAACVQHARTLGELLNSGAELAGRIAKEADGHVADKIECRAAWPV